MYCYAEVDENNICFSVVCGENKTNNPNLILIPNYDLSILGKKYNNGKWEAIQSKSRVNSQGKILSETDQAILDAAINSEYLVCLSELEL